MGSLSNDVFKRRASTGSALLESWVVILNKVPSRLPLVSIRVKTLSNTNLVASRHIKRDEDLRRDCSTPS